VKEPCKCGAMDCVACRGDDARAHRARDRRQDRYRARPLGTPPCLVCDGDCRSGAVDWTDDDGVEGLACEGCQLEHAEDHGFDEDLWHRLHMSGYRLVQNQGVMQKQVSSVDRTATSRSSRFPAGTRYREMSWRETCSDGRSFTSRTYRVLQRVAS